MRKPRLGISLLAEIKMLEAERTALKARVKILKKALKEISDVRCMASIITARYRALEALKADKS